MSSAPQPVSPDAEPLRCARCGTELVRGSGQLYVVQIRGVADPFPQILPDWDTATIRREIERTVAALRAVSAREAMDQVLRETTIYLCARCFHPWIENPVAFVPEPEPPRGGL